MNKKQNDKINKPDYEDIYNNVVLKTIKTCIDEMDDSFKLQYKVSEIPQQDFYKNYSKAFRQNRRNLKDFFYGENAHHFLNPFKISAILCHTLIECKSIKFGINFTADIVKKHQDNIWLADNVFVNFKIAFLSSVGLIYNLVLSDLVKVIKDKDTRQKCELVTSGKLLDYGLYDECSFQANVIVHIARNALMGKEFDDLWFALMMFQWYEYSMKYIK